MQNTVESITNINANNDKNHNMESQGISFNCSLAAEALLYIHDHSVGDALKADYIGI